MSALRERKQKMKEMEAPNMCKKCKKEFLLKRDKVNHVRANKCRKRTVQPNNFKLRIFECESDNCNFCTYWKKSIITHKKACIHMINDGKGNKNLLINGDNNINKNIITGDNNKIKKNIDNSTHTKNINNESITNNKIKIVAYSPEMYYNYKILTDALKADNPILELIIQTNVNKNTPHLHNVMCDLENGEIYDGIKWNSHSSKKISKILGEDIINTLSDFVNRLKDYYGCCYISTNMLNNIKKICSIEKSLFPKIIDLFNKNKTMLLNTRKLANGSSSSDSFDYSIEDRSGESADFDYVECSNACDYNYSLEGDSSQSADFDYAECFGNSDCHYSYSDSEEDDGDVFGEFSISGESYYSYMAHAPNSYYESEDDDDVFGEFAISGEFYYSYMAHAPDSYSESENDDGDIFGEFAISGESYYSYMACAPDSYPENEEEYQSCKNNSTDISKKIKQKIKS